VRLRTPLGWAADRWALGPRALRWGTTAALVASVLIVLGGVVVRVTGSGLGCPTWPTCTEDSLISTPELGIHGFIEFANRALTGVLIAAVGFAIVAARLQRPRDSGTARGRRDDRVLTRLAWSMFWLVVANAVAGGITVWVKLNPWVVALHFVLAMGLLACATFTWHRARWNGGDGPRPSAVSRGLAWALVVGTGALVVTGTLVTGSGPHAGDSKDVPRMGFDWTTVVVVHGTAALAVLVLAVALAFRLRREAGGGLALRRVGLFLLVLFVQLALGTSQSLLGIPELLVALHGVVAALVWVGALRVLLDTDPRLWAVREHQLVIGEVTAPTRP
jgi:cytochrome c oxidase assembly protein subunit 15